MGKTSEPHEGHWNTPSGRRRIFGWPHSQAWLPKASGRAAICSIVLNMASSTEKLHASQRAGSSPRSCNLPEPHAGQRMQFGLDMVRDGTLIAASFADLH